MGCVTDGGEVVYGEVVHGVEHGYGGVVSPAGVAAEFRVGLYEVGDDLVGSLFWDDVVAFDDDGCTSVVNPKYLVSFHVLEVVVVVEGEDFLDGGAY